MQGLTQIKHDISAVLQWILVKDWYSEEITVSQKTLGCLNILKLIWFQNSQRPRLIILFLFKLNKKYIYIDSKI